MSDRQGGPASLKFRYFKRERGGYYVSAGEDADNLPMIRVEPHSMATGKVGNVGYWVATHKRHRVQRDTRKEAVVALYAEMRGEQ